MSRAAHSLVTVACVVLAGFMKGCGGDGGSNPIPEDLRIYHSPYSGVDWSSDYRLKGQHHDHIALSAEKIRAYDAAGYDALALIDYSGAPDLSYALTKRLWPPDAVLSSAVLNSLQNVSIWFPSAEEVGIPSNHVNSPFLPIYVERWDPARSPVKQLWHYETSDELYTVIRNNGGLPVLAHPWTVGLRYGSYPGVFGVEIYTAFAEANRQAGVAMFVEVDRNRVLLENWDRALEINQTLIGFAVNDHFGPVPDHAVDADIRDSGKIIVLAKTKSMEGYRAGIEAGAVLAVRDMGVIKDRFPDVRSISVVDDSVTIDTDGQVTWIVHGRSIHIGSSLEFSALPSGSRYVRAEISNGEGSIVYTQALWVRPVGDADGDGSVTLIDQQICDDIAAGRDLSPDRVAACSDQD